MQMPALSFIQNKVSSIGTALFFCDSKTLLPFPAYIITALKTDDEGNIWFFISRSWNQSVTYDVSTPAKLEFYRKGYPFALSVVGLAYLVDDNETIHDFMQNLVGKSMEVKEEALRGVLLVKVTIEKVDYKELLVRKPALPIKNVLTSLKNRWSPLSFHTQLQPSI